MFSGCPSVCASLRVCPDRGVLRPASTSIFSFRPYVGLGGSVAESLACWTQAQMGLGSNRSRDAVG